MITSCHTPHGVHVFLPFKNQTTTKTRQADETQGNPFHRNKPSVLVVAVRVCVDRWWRWQWRRRRGSSNWRGRLGWRFRDFTAITGSTAHFGCWRRGRCSQSNCTQTLSFRGRTSIWCIRIKHGNISGATTAGDWGPTSCKFDQVTERQRQLLTISVQRHIQMNHSPATS